MIFDKMASERVRVHHPPDFIIKGKPKWTDIMMTEQLGQTGSSGPEERHVVDRLNPSRNMISSIESQYGESAENTQKQFKVGLLFIESFIIGKCYPVCSVCSAAV